MRKICCCWLSPRFTLERSLDHIRRKSVKCRPEEPGERVGGKDKERNLYNLLGFSATARTMTQCVSINQLAVIQPGKESNERRREVEREKKNCVMVVRAKTIAKNSSKISDAIFGYTKSARWGSCCCRCCCCLSRRDFQFQLSTVLPHGLLCPRLLFLPSVTHLKIWNTPKVKFEFWLFSKLKKNFPFHFFIRVCVGCILNSNSIWNFKRH